MTSPALETALLSARCIYWLLFKKTPKQSLCSRLYRYPNRPKPFRMQMLIFQPPNILKTPVQNGCRSLKKQRGFKRSLCACIKIASPIDISSFVCYLRQFNFAKARDFAIHTESNFSYCVKSSSATNACHLNTEENRSFIKKLGMWLLHKCLR